MWVLLAWLLPRAVPLGVGVDLMSLVSVLLVLAGLACRFRAVDLPVVVLLGVPVSLLEAALFPVERSFLWSAKAEATPVISVGSLLGASVAFGVLLGALVLIGWGGRRLVGRAVRVLRGAAWPL